MAGISVEVASVLGTVVSFTLLGRRLGPTDYGALVAMYSLIGIAICLAYIGPGLALLQIALQSNLGAVAGSFFGEQIILTCIAAPVVLLLAPVFVPSLPLTTVAMFLAAELIGTALVTLAANLRIVATGYASAMKLQLIPHIVKVVVIGGLAVSGELTLANYGFVYMVFGVVAGVIAFLMTTRSLGLSRRPKAIKSDHVRVTLSISSTIWAWGLHDNGDKLVMSANQLGPAVGLYAAGYRLVQFGMIPVNALMSSSYRSFLDPAVGRQAHRALRYTIAMTAYTTAAAVIIIVLAPVLLPILVGNQFEGSITMARWLAPLLILRGAIAFPGNALVGLGRVHARLVAFCTSATIGIVVYIILIPTMSWKGAIIGSYITDAVLVTTLWAMLFSTARQRAADRVTQALELEGNRA